MLMKSKAQNADFQFISSAQKNKIPGIQCTVQLEGKVTSFFLKAPDAAKMLLNLHASFKNLLNEATPEQVEGILKDAIALVK